MSLIRERQSDEREWVKGVREMMDKKRELNFVFWY